ncbi:MAG: PHP-associated domain-containing protein [Bacteroidota bacterium]
MLRVEFHCHTIFSKDSLVSPRALVDGSARKGIDRVVVTDHNSIAGARAAQALDPERVIVGEEVMTTQGELLAAFVEDALPAGLTPREAIRRLRQQGAFISVSHPFDSWRHGGWQEEHLLEILPLVDAIEVFNSRCMAPGSNEAADAFARRQEVPTTVGSDAHTVWELGRSTLLLPSFGSADELRNVLLEGVPKTRMSPQWIHLSSRFARMWKMINGSLDMSQPP